MLSVNELIQDAAEDLSLVGDGEAVSPELAASCEGLLNRAIKDLNSDSYISLSVATKDIMAAGNVVFRKLEQDEPQQPNSINQEPPDNIQGVARKVGIRYVRLTASNPEAQDRSLTYSLPTQWSYGVESEVAPSGATRRIGRLKLNGSSPADLRIYMNSALPKFRLGDTIYLSDLYHNLLLYALEDRMVAKYKLYSYADRVSTDLAGAMRSVDNNAAQNRPMTNDNLADMYTRPADDLLAGTGF